MELPAAGKLLPRRSLLTRLGAIGAAAPFALRFVVPPVAAQEETPELTWVPPPVPQPLPAPGGKPPPLVGAAPEEPEAPVSGALTAIENPVLVGTPGVGQDSLTTGGESAVTNPQQPPQPLATPGAPAEAVVRPPTATVVLTPDFRFEPTEVRIPAGEAVEWRNEGRSPQTVTADPARVDDEALVRLPQGAEAWDSGVLNFGDAFSHVFAVPGEYAYVSLPQEANGMVGRVVVEP